MYSDQVNAKMQAEQAYRNQIENAGVCGEALSNDANQCNTHMPRPTPTQDAERNHRYHSEQAQKAGEAAKFLSLHPEFSRFIELVRQGAIQF